MSNPYRILEEPDSFLYEVLALPFTKGWMIAYRDLLNPEFFEKKSHQAVAKLIHEFYDKHGVMPTKGQWESLLSKETADVAMVGSIIYDLAQQPLQYTHDRVKEFAQHRAIWLALLQSAQELTDGTADPETVLERFIEASRIGSGSRENSLVLMKDIDRVQSQDQLYQAVPSGILHIDHVLKGGVHEGELAMILAETNGGKSIALVNIGAAGAKAGYNVLHVTLEMSMQDIAERYYSHITGRFRYSDESPDAYKSLILNQNEFMGDIVITEAPSGTLSIRELQSRVRDLEAEHGITFGLIVVDYLSEVNLDVYRRFKEMHQKLGAATRDLRALAKKLHIPIWTADQVNRSGMIGKAKGLEHVSGSIEKVYVSDFVFILSQTPEQDASNTAELFFAKTRRVKGKGLTAMLRFNKEAMRLQGQANRNGELVWVTGKNEPTVADTNPPDLIPPTPESIAEIIEQLKSRQGI